MNILSMSKIKTLNLHLIFFILFLSNYSLILAQKTPNKNTFINQENAFRANNTGVGLLEQFKFDEAEKEFREALKLKPDFDLAKLNLAITFYNLKKLDETKQTALEYLKIDKNSLHAFYILGLTARAENKGDEALEYFRKVLQSVPNDVGANVNAGQILAQQRNYAEAIKYFETAYQAENYNLSAIYNLALSLQRTGEREKATELLEKFKVLRDTSAGVNIGLNYLEQGRYAEAIASNGTEKELVDRSSPKVKFTNATDKFFKISFKADAVTLFDFDRDGFLDLAVLKDGSISLYRNDKGVFVDVTQKSGDLAKKFQTTSQSLVAGDFDNDLNDDLLAVRNNGFTLYRNQGEGRFSDVTKISGLPLPASVSENSNGSYSSAFIDFDHEGDLDIFVSGGSSTNPNRLFRNNGDGSFTDISKEAAIADQTNAKTIIPTDFNNTRDVDLLLVGEAKTILYSNQRNDTFKDVATKAGLKIGGETATAADVNKDGFIDFFVGRSDGKSVLYLSDGKEKFIEQNITSKKLSAEHSQFLDFDNDGLIDLVISDSKRTEIWRNLGNIWKRHKKLKIGGEFLSADLDQDGDLDLVFTPRNQPLQVWRNDGGNLNNSLNLALQGRVSNRTGIGAKVLMRSGSLSQQLESYSTSPANAPSEIHFGLGKRQEVDALRILWSSGIVQSETDFAELQTARNSDFLKIQEVDRKPASCPYLYTWDGEKFVFITDFLGGGEMANWAGKGIYHYPDSDEYVRIAPDKLKPKDGFYEIRVTNELEEVLYLDKLKLVAVEHEKDVAVYPNEPFGASETPQEKFIAVKNAKPPISAKNTVGKDVTAKIRELDQVFYDDFKSLKIRGYAETHHLTLHLDDKKNFQGRTLLLLTGWTDYAFSSDNMAASQSGKSLSLPYLQVKNKKGEWQTVIDSIGISIGRPQTLIVDLTDKFLTDSREVRIVTNFKTFWDKIEIDTSNEKMVSPNFEIEPYLAELRERGYSVETKIGGMRVPDYSKVSFDSRWKNFAGRYTRTGDVLPFIQRIDDVFVISKAGDEFVLKFRELPKLPANKVYTFLLYADGYSKEADINSGSPDNVLPLPFKGMKKYPYDSSESFPMTEEKQQIYGETLTRYIRGGIDRTGIITANE